MTRGRPILLTLAMAGIIAVAWVCDAGAALEDNRPLRVLVVDTQRRDVPNITVEVRAPDSPRHSFATGANGTVSIPSDVAVEGAVLTAVRGREAVAWTKLGDQSQAGAGARRSWMMLLPLNHRVEGSVVNREGKPVAGARVGVEMLSHPTNQTLDQDLWGKDPLLGFGVTDQAGKFTVTLPQNARARLRVLHTRSISPPIEVATNARTLGPAILEPTGVLRGRLTDAATGKPLAGAAVAAQLIERLVRHLTDGWGQAVTDDRGGFAIDGLEPGVYNVLLLEVPGRERATARAVEAVRIREGEEATADLSVIEGKPLRGVVIDRETDRPMAGAQVGCQGPSVPRSGAAILGTKTDEQGRFLFPVPPGEQFVYLIDDLSSRSMSRHVVVVTDQAEVMPILLLNPKGSSDFPTTAEQPEDADVDAPAGGVSIVNTIFKVAERIQAADAKPRTVTGRVNDSQGRPLPVVRVTAGQELRQPGAGPDALEVAVTDREGRFVLGGLLRHRGPISIGRTGEEVQKEMIPADRDEVTLTYRPQPDEKARNSAARVEDEPIPAALRERLTFVDLTAYANNFLGDGPGGLGDSNHLNRVPRGLHKLGDAYFRIGEKMVHVKGQASADKPVSIAGIKVAARGKRLHILHACQQQAEAGTEVGYYVVRYVNGFHETVPIVYGKNLVDWWHFGGQNNDPSDARIAWTGSNEMIDDRHEAGLEIHLFAFTWTNPHPDKEISTIDMVSSESACDPYLIALTVERDPVASKPK